jgi:hypothetical protein
MSEDVVSVTGGVTLPELAEPVVSLGARLRALAAALGRAGTPDQPARPGACCARRGIW